MNATKNVMDKNKVSQYIRLFQMGNLSTEKELELQDWIKQSEENMAFFRQQTETAAIESLNTKSGTVEKQLHDLSGKLNFTQAKRRFNKRWLQLATVAAIFLIGVLLTAFVMQMLNSSSLFKKQMQTVYTPLGAKSNFTLDDGTQVWLNSGSKLTFAESFGKRRNISLEGEAFLEVTKDNRPFVVETRYGEVEVKGTAFNVKAYKDEAFVTTLTEGRVEVRDEHKKVLLNPGEQAIKKNGVLYVKNVDPYQFSSWKDGVLIFKENQFPFVVKQLARWYNVKITLSDDSRLQHIKVTSTIEGEPLIEVMELLEIVCPISYSYNKNERTIHIKYKPIKIDLPM